MKKIVVLLFLFIGLFGFGETQANATGALKIWNYSYPNAWVDHRNVPPIPNGFEPFGFAASYFYIINPTTGVIKTWSYSYADMWIDQSYAPPMPSGFEPIGYEADFFYIINPATGVIKFWSYSYSTWLDYIYTLPMPNGFEPVGYEGSFFHIMNPATGMIKIWDNSYYTWTDRGFAPPIPNGFEPIGYASGHFYIISHQNDTTPPSADGFQANYSTWADWGFRAHLYNIKDDNSGVNRVEYWSRRHRLDGVAEDWIHHGTGGYWNDNGFNSYFDIPARGEGAYEIRARVYDNAGNVAGPWGMWVDVDLTSPSTGVPDYDNGVMRYTNAPDGATVRFHTHQARDNFSGIGSVYFWSKIESHQDWTHQAYGVNYYNNEAFYYDMPIQGEGQYIARAHAMDNVGNGHGQNGWSNGVDMRVIVDRTKPTATGATVSGRKLNATTFRVEVFGVSDNLAGVRNVRFPTWTTENGHDDLIWYEGVHAGNGHWYIDVPIANHGNAEGQYVTHVYAYDHANNENIIGMVDTVIDLTKPTATGITVSGRKLNATTFRVEAHGVFDGLSGIEKVVFPTWTNANGQDDLKEPWSNQSDYQGINAGGGTWYVDIPISKHNNEEGEYLTHIYAWDKAGNQGYFGEVNTVIDLTRPQLISSVIEGADYVSGNDYWLKPGKTVTTTLRARDELSGMYTIYHVFTGTNGTAGHSWIGYNVLSNAPELVLSGTTDAFDLISQTESYHVGNEAETVVVLSTKATNDIRYYDFKYNIYDVAINPTTDTLTGKRIIVDGKTPAGTLTSSKTTVTNQDIVITATGSDEGSGMKRIKLPNGNFVNGASATYTVGQNGTYTFEFEDHVGNVTTKTITVSNLDKIAPTIVFTPEEIEQGYEDIAVQVEITDEGVSGYQQHRYVWSISEDKPTEGWSDWKIESSPLVGQTEIGDWFLHMEAIDHAGNLTYAFSGLYQKSAMRGGPSIQINVYPLPKGNWVNQPIDVYVMESGDDAMLEKARKFYEVTNSSLLPSSFTNTIPADKKVRLNLVGENFIHVHYVLEDGTKIYAVSGPYLIDTGTIGDFEMMLQDKQGITITDWSNEELRLVMTDPTNTSISGYEKQYRIEGVHLEWQRYKEGMTISIEGKHRAFGRIVNKTGEASEQKFLDVKIDRTNPTVQLLRLEKRDDDVYRLTAKASDDLSDIQKVSTDKGVILSFDKTNYQLTVTDKPNTLIVEDVAGNKTTTSFATEPIITFQAPYAKDLEVYREDVVVEISGAERYVVGNRSYECTSDPCLAQIGFNTNLTAVHTDGVKVTETIVTIDNIDKRTHQLMLRGKRNNINPKQIELTWNYALQDAVLTCTEDGKEEIYPVIGTRHVLSGKNYLHYCSLTGIYKTLNLTSNTVTIYPTPLLPSQGGGHANERIVNENVSITETKMGKVYMINGKKDDYKYDYVPVPNNDITKD